MCYFSSYETGELMYAACQCSSMVYSPVAQAVPELIPVMSRTPSMTGTTKAVSIWKLGRSNALIVSVRGSASAADHMVNMNANPKDASSIFVRPLFLPKYCNTDEIARSQTLQQQFTHTAVFWPARKHCCRLFRRRSLGR